MIYGDIDIMQPWPLLGTCIVGVELESLSQEQIYKAMAIATGYGHTPTLRLLKLKDGLIPFLEVCRGPASAEPEEDAPDEMLELWEKLTEAIGWDFEPKGYSPVQCMRGVRREIVAA